ncbi:uncharacterized protein E5676_scaffold180G00170 [Cucumis melo var. makuwa]|uniref:Reverse transcriptase/retrotransposon-derived protein RNase H-like domain-containing protein n=1 Tax=Cucumis melo var. makuwa TaxID=1194695 RepID=A0A5A7U7B7_CUCMM|nr:uncharacterized protein E6C27_scaffold355G001180 [Cucumis melo var. makuwa]TYJ98139.1 uncharacterized protein E5676_scaffold180G00170 [Cucumis melo var. makuwa]
MNGSSGYNQIRMAVDDEKTTFQTLKDTKVEEPARVETIARSFGLHQKDQSCQNAFDNINKYLLNPSILSALASEKPLILYIAVQETSLGALLVQENDNGKKCALYYLSRTLTGAEFNYSPIEKMCLVLSFAIDKLRNYMQTFTIHLVAKADLVKYILSRLVIAGCLGKWVIILQQYDIIYIPQKAVKGQTLADFLADHPVPSNWKLWDNLRMDIKRHAAADDLESCFTIYASKQFRN